MSGIRRSFVFALCLCLLLALVPGTASAADERTTRPAVKVTEAKTMRPGLPVGITVSCTKPGFLDARILDGEGNELAVLADALEVPTGRTTVYWDGVMEDGRLVEPTDACSIALSMRDEWGNETRNEVVSTLRIGDPAPTISDVGFTFEPKKHAWIITGTASVPGKLMIDLHAAHNLEDRYMNIADGHKKTHKKAQITQANAQFSWTWDGFITEESEDDTSAYLLDPGYYALSVYLEDADGIRSVKTNVFVSVGADDARTAYITGEEPAGFSISTAKEAQMEDAGDEDAQNASADAEPAAAPVSLKGENGLTLGVVMGESGLQIGAGVSDTAEQTDGGYWTLSAQATDAEIWAALTRPMISVDEDERNSVSLLAEPKSGAKKLAQVNGLTQGLNVVGEVGDWSIVEVFRNEDSAFTRGYIRTSRLRTVETNQEYGVTIDKATQTLTVWHNGERVGSVPVCTGLATAEHPDRETMAGEFILATRMGAKEMYMGFCEYTIRISGDMWLHEIPSTRRKGSDFSKLQGQLGTKTTRGTIAVAHESSADGAINMEWIWENLKEKRIKVLIFDDKARDVVPYLNPADFK